MNFFLTKIKDLKDVQLFYLDENGVRLLTKTTPKLYMHYFSMYLLKTNVYWPRNYIKKKKNSVIFCQEKIKTVYSN